MSEYSVRKLESSEFELLIPIVKDCFGVDTNIEYFKWKFLNNPSGEFIGFIAEHNETKEVGAYYGVIPESYMVDGKEKIVYQSCDTMTHSKHRRKGLFQKLAIHCYNYLRQNNQLFVIGFGGDQSTPGFIKFGWQKLFDFQYVFIPKLLCYFRMPSFNKSDIVESPSYDVLSDLSANKLHNTVYSSRSADIIQWRYANPRVQYKTIGFKTSQKFEGFVTYYLDNSKIIIFDFVFTSSKSKNALIRYLKQLVVRENFKGIVGFCQQKGVPYRQLRSSGFLRNPLKRGFLSGTASFIFYADQEAMTKYNDPKLWSIESFDHDSF